ncbi:endonuclease [Flavobacterium sp. 3HN19-14]|uniref:endonuclease n=1 Tax=Flavobacterium sp. 3HN19-14 TaxID=3448133 RepID=UPI003EE192E3
MKTKYTLLLLLVSIFGFAQIPAGYYNTATGTGYVLKTQLYTKIHTHTAISYSPGLWNLYPSSDAKANGKVWDIYSNCDFNFGTGANGNQTRVPAEQVNVSSSTKSTLSRKAGLITLRQCILMHFT